MAMSLNFFSQGYFDVLMKTLLLKSSAQRGDDELVNICFPKSLFYFFLWNSEWLINHAANPQSLSPEDPSGQIAMFPFRSRKWYLMIRLVGAAQLRVFPIAGFVADGLDILRLK